MKARRRSLAPLPALADPLEPRRLLAGGVDRLVNDNAGSTGTSSFTQSEASLVAFGNTVVVGFDDSGSYNGSNNQFTGWSRSTDGGNVFTDGGTLPASTGGDIGDPMLAGDETTGRIYFCTLGFNAATIQVFRSDTNGASWQTPVNGTPGGSVEDMPWLTVDNFAGAGRGNVYLVTSRSGSFGSDGLYLYRSTNGGDTFSNGVLLTASDAPLGANIVVGPDHTIYIFWFASPGQIVFRKSIDRGVSFTPALTIVSSLSGWPDGDLRLVGNRTGGLFGQLFRTNSFPHAAVNPVNGHVYLTYNDNGSAVDKADIFLIYSSNGGVSWSSPVRVNDDSTTKDQWQPTIAVTPDGTHLGIFYYSRQEDSANNLYRFYGRLALASSAPPVFAFSSPVSDVLSYPEFGRDSLLIPTYMGDRNTIAATNDAFHVAWADNRSDLPGGSPRKDPNVYYDKVRARFEMRWTGQGDGLHWSDPLNWDGLFVPTAAYHAIIPTGFANILVDGGTYSAKGVEAASPLTVDSPLIIQGNGGVVVLSSLAISATGKLDVGNNDLILNYTGGSPVGSIRNWINTARAGGAWTGNGISSFAAKGANPRNTTLGVMEATEYRSVHGPAANFDNQLIDNTTVLVKYTYYGDTDFNGVVDFDDYSRTDSGFNLHKSGWLNGDFDGNGQVDFDDYSLIDLAFNTQAGTLRPSKIKLGALFARS